MESCCILKVLIGSLVRVTEGASVVWLVVFFLIVASALRGLTNCAMSQVGFYTKYYPRVDLVHQPSGETPDKNWLTKDILYA